jgi:hypothetical protein
MEADCSGGQSSPWAVAPRGKKEVLRRNLNKLLVSVWSRTNRLRGSCVHGTESPCSISGTKLIDRLSDYQLLQDSAAWSQVCKLISMQQWLRERLPWIFNKGSRRTRIRPRDQMWQVTGTVLSSSLKLNQWSPTNRSDVKPLVLQTSVIMSRMAAPSVHCLHITKWPYTGQFIKRSMFPAVSSLGNQISYTG